MNSNLFESNPNPSPLEQMGKKRSHLRVVAFIVAVHVVFLGGLLIQGCKPDGSGKPPQSTSNTATNEPSLPQENSNYYKSLDPATNAGSAVVSGNADTNNTAGSYPQADSTQLSNTVSQIVPENPGIEAGAAGSQTGGAPTEYAIKSGDTLARIAKAHRVSLVALQEANPGIQPSRLKIGQKIQVPAAKVKVQTSNSGVVSSIEASHPAGGGVAAGPDKSYVVKTGDSLIRIAKAQGISVKELKAANNLRTDRINVGQKLKLPANSAPAGGAVSPVTNTGAAVNPSASTN